LETSQSYLSYRGPVGDADNLSDHHHLDATIQHTARHFSALPRQPQKRKKTALTAGLPLDRLKLPRRAPVDGGWEIEQRACCTPQTPVVLQQPPARAIICNLAGGDGTSVARKKLAPRQVGEFVDCQRVRAVLAVPGVNQQDVCVEDGLPVVCFAAGVPLLEGLIEAGEARIEPVGADPIGVGVVTGGGRGGECRAHNLGLSVNELEGGPQETD
jgi:hypothetical protein